MKDYPTTADVRDCYIYADERYDGEIATPPGTAGAQFDRWLAEVERAAAEKAYREGYMAASSLRMGPQHNPYRKETP